MNDMQYWFIGGVIMGFMLGINVAAAIYGAYIYARDRRAGEEEE